MITFYINLGSLDSWLTLEPFQQLVEENQLAIDWQPLIGSLGNVAGTPKADDPLAEYKARRAKARQQAAAREHERVCEMLNITTEAGKKTPNPLIPSLGLLWLKGKGASDQTLFGYAGSVFAAEFKGGSDVESVTVVEKILGFADVDTLGFDAFVASESEKLNAEQDQLLENGILSAPAFIVDGEIFHGREHLPLITWMVSGRKGSPPV